MTRRILTTAATLLAAGAVGACGGSSSHTTVAATPGTATAPISGNGIAARSPAEILRAALSAAASARTVHVAGHVVSHGSPLVFDLRVVAGRGSIGELATQGLRVKFVALGPVMYLNGGEHFWRKFLSQTLAQRLNRRWVQVPSTANVAGIARLANLRALFGEFLLRRATFVKGPTVLVHGQQVLAIHSLTRGGTLYIATTGAPYPIEVRGSPKHPGRVVFDQYNRPISLQAPPGALTASSSGGI
jgi:hypothetical protein